MKLVNYKWGTAWLDAWADGIGYLLVGNQVPPRSLYFPAEMNLTA